MPVLLDSTTAVLRDPNNKMSKKGKLDTPSPKEESQEGHQEKLLDSTTAVGEDPHDGRQSPKKAKSGTPARRVVPREGRQKEDRIKDEEPPCDADYLVCDDPRCTYACNAREDAAEGTVSNTQLLSADQLLLQQNMDKLPGAAVSIRGISKVLTSASCDTRAITICVESAQRGLEKAIQMMEDLNERAKVPDSAPYSRPETREEEQLRLDNA